MELVGPVCLEAPPPPPLFAPPPATRPGLAPPSLQNEEELVEVEGNISKELVEVEEPPALSTGMVTV